MSYITNQNVEKSIILVNIFYLLFFMRYIQVKYTLCFTTSEKFLNNFKNRFFPIKNLEPEPETETEREKEPKPKHFFSKILKNSKYVRIVLNHF